MLNLLDSVKSLSYLADGGSVVRPIYDAYNMIAPYALSVLLVLSMFYGVFLGVKYAKTEDAAEKANVQKILVNFCIGAGTIIILLSVMHAIHDPLIAWIDRGE